jgi:prevent-host-death family protein
MEKVMEWQLAEAKNRFSEVVNKALAKGPQFVRRRGDVVVIVAQQEYLKLTGKRRGFKGCRSGGSGSATRPLSDARRETVKVLLDTCALSELRLPKPDAGVAGAIAELHNDDLFVSAITIGEIVKGVALLPDGQKKRILQSWLRTLERDYGDRLLPVDLETCRMWGELTAAAQKAGRTIPATA